MLPESLHARCKAAGTKEVRRVMDLWLPKLGTVESPASGHVEKSAPEHVEKPGTGAPQGRRYFDGRKWVEA